MGRIILKLILRERRCEFFLNTVMKINVPQKGEISNKLCMCEYLLVKEHPVLGIGHIIILHAPLFPWITGSRTSFKKRKR